MDDLISRQAAIDEAKKRHDFFRGATTPADKARRDELLEMTVWLSELPSAQPELIEKSAYIRGFEQGRIQGMIDAQERKK